MNRKINDRLKLEKASLSYADFRHEITKNDKDNSLKPYGNKQKQATYQWASEEDELVKYMSNLPGYLEKGEKIPDKALNVGVLDWATLQQWQYSHKHVPLSSRSSTSTINTSSSVSTEGLSGNSSKGFVCSPSRQRIFRPSLQSHFMASPMQDYSVSVKSSGGNFGNCQNLRGGCSNIDTHSNDARVGDHLSQNHPTSIPKGCVRRQLNPHINKESDILPNGGIYEAASHTKIEMSPQDGGPEKKVENFREPNIDADEQVMLGKSKPIVLILPRDIPQNNHCEVPDMQTSLGQKLGSPTGTRLSEKPKEPPCRYPNSNISKACPLPDEIRGSRCQPKRSGSSSIDPEDVEIPASTFSAPVPVRTGISPCRSRKAEEKKHNIGASSSANGSLKVLDQKVTTEKPRSSSPFRRFSFSIGFAGKGSGCKEVAHVPHQSSLAALKSSSENVRGYAGSKFSGNDKPGNAAKSRSSSPLRRLLDPLLKPKTSNSHRTVESYQKDSVVIKKNCRSGNGEFSMEKELDRDQRVGCTTINTVDLSKNKKYVPSTFQALLRIAVKNGQPLFTFAVDNNSNILVATVKNLAVSKEDKCNRIYTFFTFREGKKKNGSWMNQASKTKGPDYIHHAVAQMKVSDSHHYDSTSQNCVNSSTTKEFVLFSVKLKQGDAQVTDYEPNDELAAIVVKSAKAVNFINYAHQSSCQNDSQDLHVTVVLPTGVHSLPSNGGPSSLIERWRTGGSCDCGGWDMACKLKILADESQACRKSRISKACFPHPFELFLQVNDQDQENQPAFSFSPFKPGVYSVAFDSSFSLLQAFSICIALVDGLISYELSGSRNHIEGKNSRETLLVQTDELKAFGKLEDIPASYVAYPPLSPVGRV
ncbi:hypothetical protein JHK82_041279 [Glycine max]|uniref:DUF3527 domain-containing protein n=1 Tax=Glycine max TaxID=3847 RepID=K7M9C3_SOYBN|nr:uncharacterized protein LOC100818834 [Glycine max]XP_006597262.1 uncharacterized protein LOC100818834 [Glycine max]KAG4380892.1 hypothetical protein GLYMA_15G034800v4 [Glycine max]KAG5104309.1 hypothetical protein JHK82_041279 [Glycine max]KAH1145368.1 hypothetical protein GYH30_041226 [Glycine max]KAH1145369.1 hypothetical protein GYH30_041226 [Glycine max]KAH1145370.1 hypothetical protein GYH30_041226 [Glycine max]|eukprot:XP_003547004.1 uncharacterized protein LOC100818834 [Glycine max]